MSTESVVPVTPAKRRGNPNWVKRPSETEISTTVEKMSKSKDTPISDADAWLELYGSVLITYNGIPGNAVVSAAATAADQALNEFRKRYPK